MAITAAMTVSSATAANGTGVTATCTVTNSGTDAVTVTGIQPSVTPHSATTQSVAALVGLPPLGPGATVSVAGSNGTRAFGWGVSAFAPQAQTSGVTGNPANPAQYVYDLGATVFTSDGSITVASTTTLTVTAATLQ